MIIKLPKWLNDVSIYIFFEYLRTGEITEFLNSEIPVTDSTMQKLLWAADYFQTENLEEKCIKQCIFPKMTKENVLLFLSEATKKLEVSKDSNEIWNELLDYSLEIASKNLQFLIKRNLQELAKVNGKLFKEIFERFIKSEKNLNNTQMKEILDFILIIKKVDDIVDLLNSQKKSIVLKSNKGFFEG